MSERRGSASRLAWALLAGVTCGLMAAGPAGAAEPARPYVFAVIPHAPPVVVSARWSPIVERISRESGVPLKMKLYAGIAAFDSDLAAGVPDFAFLHPEQATRAHRKAGYRPLVRDSDALQAVLFVRRDSPYTSVSSLAGREVALMGEWSFCSIVLRHELASFGIVPRYVGTPANAYKQVVVGMVPAGGALDQNLGDASPEERQKLRVVYQTQPLASHPLVAHPRVPREVTDRITATVLALARTESGSQLLRTIGLRTPVQADYERDYVPVERLLSDAATAKPAERSR